jgi:hypothetical protein|tara:strand:- start:984 stop:1238 length:255 start_codon:yes stop_codon:yes gene_type:complete
MELDAFAAILIGIYQVWDNLAEVIETKEVRVTKQYAILSLIAGLLWLSHQYRTGMNSTAVITVLGLIANLYMLYLINSKEKKKE